MLHYLLVKRDHLVIVAVRKGVGNPTRAKSNKVYANPSLKGVHDRRCNQIWKTVPVSNIVTRWLLYPSVPRELFYIRELAEYGHALLPFSTSVKV